MVIGILNDRAWGMIKADQPGGRHIGVDFHDADYAAIARGFGCFGEQIWGQVFTISMLGD